MEKIYPVTALAKNQPEVKEAARVDLVRITEHGKSAFIFCSEEIFEERLSEAVDKALEEYEISQIIQKGRQAFEEGRYIVGTEAARAESMRRRKLHA